MASSKSTMEDNELTTLKAQTTATVTPAQNLVFPSKSRESRRRDSLIFTKKPKKSFSENFFKLFSCLSPSDSSTSTKVGSHHNELKVDHNRTAKSEHPMSAGERTHIAEMAAASVLSHSKQPSTSSRTSDTLPTVTTKGIQRGLAHSHSSPNQKKFQSVTSPSSSDHLNHHPQTVSKEYHQTSMASSDISKHPNIRPASQQNGTPSPVSNNEDDSEFLDSIKIQEADQHDYENPVAIEAPTIPSNEMHDEHGNLLTSLGPGAALLAPIKKEFAGRKCLVLDLDETLVHSSFSFIHNADFIIPVQIESEYHNVYVIKRPGVDEFMRRMGELYEVVVFTASVSKYGDPLLDQLDIHNVVHHRLFRESCYNNNGNFVKNLAVLGRPLHDTIIIDNSPTSYIFHPQHAVPVSSWFFDAHDNELLDMIPFLEDLATSQVPDVSAVLNVNLD